MSRSEILKSWILQVAKFCLSVHQNPPPPPISCSFSGALDIESQNLQTQLLHLAEVYLRNHKEVGFLTNVSCGMLWISSQRLVGPLMCSSCQLRRCETVPVHFQWLFLVFRDVYLLQFLGEADLTHTVKSIGVRFTSETTKALHADGL